MCVTRMVVLFDCEIHNVNTSVLVELIERNWRSKKEIRVCVTVQDKVLL